MRRRIAPILIIVLLFSLCGCQHRASSTDTVSFFYRTETIDFNTHKSIIQEEKISKQNLPDNLQQLLELYLSGPQTEDLYCPIPQTVSVQNVQRTDNSINVLLSTNFSQLNGIDLSVACVCLGKTLLSCTDVQMIKIQAESAKLDGEPSVVITPESVLILD